jgi:CRISPR system Cascade subunit CasB
MNNADEKYLNFLQSLRNNKDRGALASLRRGLRMPPGQAPEMYGIVIPYIPNEISDWESKIYFMIGAFFGLHPTPNAKGNMGDVFKRLHVLTKSDSVENRFRALLNCHSEDLHNHMRHAISLAKSHVISINWIQLLQDLRGWNWESRFVQRRWASSYWGPKEKD